MILSKALRAAAGNIAPAPPSTDPQFNYVSMLLHGDGTNGAQNNTFIDSSTNNFTITRNGNTTQGSLSPYGSLWSNYFDGNGDYLSSPTSTSLDFGTGDFTVEAWVNIDSTVNPNRPDSLKTVTVFSTGSSGSNDSSFAIYGSTASPGVGMEFYQASPSIAFAVAAPVPLNSWVHVAWVRSGTTFYAFVNGVRYTLGTSSSAVGTSGTTPKVAIANTSGYTNQFKGGISNLRVIKGTALYTSNFTPSTSPLTAVSGTSLLTCQSNRFIDNSANNFTITRNGDVRVTKEAPFLPTAAYSTSTIGGSGYFDGNGDYLSLTSNSAFDFGTGNFTIEFWYNSNVSSAAYGAFIMRNTQRYVVCMNGSGNAPQMWVDTYSVSVPICQSTTNICDGAWHHIAAVRNGNVFSIYVDGIAGSTTNTWTGSIPTTTGQVWIGNDSDYTSRTITGYMSNMRVVKGTALYTANFTPPTAPLTAITNTSLLLNFTNAGIFDNAAKNDLETVGNAQISTSIKKYGTGSIYLNGGPYLTAQQSPNMILGAGDFTIEGWVYPTNNNFILIDFRPDSTNGAYPSVYCDNGTFGYYVSSTFRIRNGTVTLNAWQHIAVVRFSGTTTMYVNGVSVGSFADSFNYIVGANRPVIGVNGYATYATTLNGYIDDLRVTKGYARYTANFTPPTAAFPNQ